MRLKRGKDILFVIRNELMFNQALPIYQILRKERGIRCWFCYFDCSGFENLRLLQKKYPLRWVSYRWAEAIKWDLILMPDHGPYFRKDVPKIYSGHGLFIGKKIDGHSYIFGPRSLNEKGEIIYNKIFTSSHYIAEEINRFYPAFAPNIRVVGNLFADEFLKYQESRRLEDLRRLHFREDKKTIMLASTWGPNSMFQSCAHDFKRAVESLSSLYNVIVSLHFLNYIQSFYQGIKAEDVFHDIPNGIYVIPPHELGNRYLSLVDLLCVDHTSLGLYFPALCRPIIFYDNPAMTYLPHSLIFELRKAAYRVENLNNLSGDIQECLKKFDETKMQLVSEKIFSYPGRASQRYKEEIFDSLGLKI